jgi:general secretion pathway protein I
VTRRARVRRLGFSLLEVLVAVSVLGLGLTVILAAQTGMVTSSRRAQVMSHAVGLARCKMNEIEEQLLREGYQLTKEEEEGPCCEDDESGELSCAWSIAPVVLPDLSQAGFGGPDAGAGASPESSLDTLSGAADDLAGGDSAGAVSALMGGGDALGGGGPSMGAGAIAPLAMSLIYPQLKLMLEASIRKVTVQVRWMEGSTERDLTVTQYVTNPQQGGLMDVDDDAAAGAAGAGSGSGAGSGGFGNRPAGAPPAPTRSPGQRSR